MDNVIKFIHLLSVLGLFSLTIYCLAIAGSNKIAKFNRLNQLLLILSLMAIISGTFLVYPKHFTFHTTWIQAAYLFTILFGLSILFLSSLKKKSGHRWAWQLAYLLLILLLMAIVHDAVTKTSLLDLL